jgi:hypothetical protein
MRDPHIDLSSKEWFELRDWLEHQIKLQIDLLKSDQTEETTWKIRGRIAGLESVMKLDRKRNPQA